MNIARKFTVFGAGVLFAMGLAIGGMTQPSKVVGFLDVTGSWDPSLLLVMIGAIAVYMPLYRLVTRRSAPFLAATFTLPSRKDLDARLLFGAALFGVGWGAAGYCPGPALASLATGSTSVIVFVLAMLTGMSGFRAANDFFAGQRSAPRQTTAANDALDGILFASAGSHTLRTTKRGREL